MLLVCAVFTLPSLKLEIEETTELVILFFVKKCDTHSLTLKKMALNLHKCLLDLVVCAFPDPWTLKSSTHVLILPDLGWSVIKAFAQMCALFDELRV